MRSRRSLSTSALLFSLALCLLGLSRAQDFGDDNDVQVVFAVYVGQDNYFNVTDKVTDLLKNSPHGFFAKPDALHLQLPSPPSMSLIILFNYNSHRHYYIRRDSGPRLSVGLLKEAAKIDDSHETAVTESGQPDDAPRVVFAAYGIHENFYDVTDLTKKLLIDQPEGFLTHEDVMGGDPEWANPKTFVAIFDYKGKFHYFAEPNGGIKVTMQTLVDAAKSDSEQSGLPSFKQTAPPDGATPDKAADAPKSAYNPFGTATPAAQAKDLALNGTVKVSSIQDPDGGKTFLAQFAVDGNDETRWSSKSTDDEWISVDLGGPLLIDHVRLHWENAYARAYSLQVSDDEHEWTDVYSTQNGPGGVETLIFKPVTARFVRMHGIKRAINYGYSLFSFEVYSPLK